MNNFIQPKNALISVFYKDGLGPIVEELSRLGVNIYSTGGTQAFIEDLGAEVKRVEDLTSYPSILGGRVKTLHPKVFGGILSRRELKSDNEQLKEYDIPEFDIVIVDLYPFEETVASGADEQSIIEKIDIGGISLIRAAAKNFKDVTVISSKDDYSEFHSILKEKNGTTIEERRRFATKSFHISSHYDSAIFSYFDNDDSAFKFSIPNGTALRYGENPHQKGVFYGNLDGFFDQLHGKALSYNNLLDVDAAVHIISEFEDTTFAILKHNNACGIASRDALKEAYIDALAGDPISAFGGILVCNSELDLETANQINTLFFEIIIAPSYQNEALEVLKSKKNRIILVQKETVLPNRQFRTILNGVLEQDKDVSIDRVENMKTVTKIEPSKQQLADLEFASKVCKNTKSNAIVLVKNNQLLASGVGQTSRVDALKQAIAKAKQFDFELEGCVMASDAFFPFADCVEIAHEAGVKAVIQPGGSIKDQLSIDYCDENKMVMVMTGTRHFKH
ncbi:MAG: bifunctional phosphoribosylaminoimidazolecarboxamide formyltransferase/IMP cyclohydrolase [Flavobacteriales bacterium]|nr:bifunctional phosphoribosylaminoimidazolecarboxamide formyltransferase/IMP cyclohydrolase [Flavobacteriales bacterium]MBL6872579.1 bifunctional phosphoribosylaminoimidazolecarboxamide formyltransferase/IMP cyclohydrolase [Flavobacteriales bacterium]